MKNVIKFALTTLIALTATTANATEDWHEIQDQLSNDPMDGMELALNLELELFPVRDDNNEEVERKSDEDEMSLIMGGWSQHFTNDSSWCYNGECHTDFNETNNAFGYEYNNFALVVMTNSYYETSTAFYYTWEPEMTSFKYVDFGARFGLVHGYEDTPAGEDLWEALPLTPLVSLVAELKPFEDIDYLRNLHGELGVFPGGEGTVVATLNFKWVL